MVSVLRKFAGGAVRASQGRSRVLRDWNGGDRQLGDYPVLPWASAQHRDPLSHWDKQDRRDRGETVHEQDETLGVWAYDSDPYTTKWKALGALLVAFSGLGAIVGIISFYDPTSWRPTAKRELPFNNLYLELGGDPDKEPK